MFRETKVISRTASNNNKGKVETSPTYPRKASNKISLHDLNLINSKYLADVTAAGSEEEKELQQLSKMIRSHSFNNNDKMRKSPAESLLKRFIPKYKPNSIKLHKPSVVSTGNVIKDQSCRSPILQPLKQSQSASQSFSEPDNSKSSTPGHPRSSLSSSCIKLPPTHPPNSNSNSSSNQSVRSKSTNTKANNKSVKSTNKKPRKVRFQKKIIIHYVPSDEERGSYEWRKNLTRQGIFEAMLWKSEIEKLELEEEEEALKNNNYYNNSFPPKGTNNNYKDDINNSNILSVYGFK